MLAALVECAFELRAQGRGFVSDEDAQTLRELRNEYSKLDLKAALGTYRVDLQRVHQILRTIGTNVANDYQSEIEKLAAVSPLPQILLETILFGTTSASLSNSLPRLLHGSVFSAFSTLRLSGS